VPLLVGSDLLERLPAGRVALVAGERAVDGCRVDLLRERQPPALDLVG
jgi:hypothetical protein